MPAKPLRQTGKFEDGEKVADEPLCARCMTDYMSVWCGCGRSYDERAAEGFTDAIGILRFVDMSREELAERYGVDVTSRAPPRSL